MNIKLARHPVPLKHLSNSHAPSFVPPVPFSRVLRVLDSSRVLFLLGINTGIIGLTHWIHWFLHHFITLLQCHAGAFANLVPLWWRATLCCCSATQSCPTLCEPMDCTKPGVPVLHHLPECSWTHVHWVGDAIQPSHPLFFPSHPAFYLSQHQGLFQWVSSSYQVAKYWSFSFSISPSNEYSGLISFRIDWFDLLAVQGTLKSVLQHPNSKASILWDSAFFMAQLSHPYMTTGKNRGFD